MKIQQIMKELNIVSLLVDGTIGIEKEGQRIDAIAHLVQTDHPDSFGARHYHPYIQTDFAESQMELITPPCASVQEVSNWLEAIHDVVLRSLPNNEWLWPFSIPAAIPAVETVRLANLENVVEVEYRNYLAKKYGKAKQLVSGIHFNYQFNPELINRLAQQAGKVEPLQIIEFTNAFYFKVAKNYLRYEWILIYLFGASPYAPQAYFDQPITFEMPVRSIRSSRYGYVNKQEVVVAYDSLVDYITSIETMVADRRLLLEKELYESVRLRGGKQVSELLTKGIQYLEFRSFDLNPYQLYGMGSEDIQFIALFIQLMAWLDEEADGQAIDYGKSLKDQTALQNPTEPALQVCEAERLLNEMLELIVYLPSGQQEKMRDSIVRKKYQLTHPHETVAAKIVRDFPFDELVVKGMEVARANKDYANKEPFALKGFTNLELSTQIMMFDALQKGVTVAVLDERDQFLSLTFDGHTEYVKNGNMTSLDSVSSMLAMANKVVTKKILAQNGLAVPYGYECHQADEAERLWQLVKEKAVVIKPKSTNYGIGITIFKQPPTFDDFKQAISIAFRADQSILIEEYCAGTEYRFFVIGDETKAVLLRKPANVVGDGIHTIQQLVEMKNRHPYRGHGHQYPLTKITLGETEQLMLKQQQLEFDSIVPAGTVVFLRENSNISTGGDSIDVTEQMPYFYKNIASQAAHALQAVITGIDMIIPEPLVEPLKEQVPQHYTIIEANFNPAMMMHVYPAQGQGRRLSLDVLQTLFPMMMS